MRLDYLPDDGYTEDAYIAAVPGIHGAFRFKYRPMLIEEQSALSFAGREMKPAAYDQKCGKEMAAKLVEWSLCDKRGEPVPVSVRAVLMLKPRLFNRLFAIVLGNDASDPDPYAAHDGELTATEEQYESALSGRTVGEVRQERDEKNSVPG